ncbi:Neuropilin-2, partial [Armadillidium vulgare]
MEDFVEIYNIYKVKGTDNEIQKINGRYCGQAIPGPVQNERNSIGLRVILRTDHEGVYSGFDANYLFKKKQPFFRDCGSNITKHEWGEITSPNWPEKYGSPASDESFTCDWFIYVRPQHKILLWFAEFSVEGNPLERGCPAAVVRVWTSLESTPMELCGDKLSPEISQIISVGSVLRLSFTTARKAGQKCDQFLCNRNNFCISKNLRCNGYQNCGLGTKASDVNVLMLVGLCVGVSAAIVLVICIWCHRKRVRRREAKSLPHHVHVCERGARFASMDSLHFAQD